MSKTTRTTIASGGSASFFCNVSDASQTIWLAGTTEESDRPIAQNSRVYDLYRGQYSLSSLNHGDTTELNLTVLNASKDGIYTCQEESNTILIAQLIVEGESFD